MLRVLSHLRTTMFSCPCQLHSLCSTLRYPNPTICVSYSLNQHNPESSSASGNSNQLLRKHNSRSIGVLFHQRSRQKHREPINPTPRDFQDQIPDDEKVESLEFSLVRTRTPQFPGFHSPGGPDVGPSFTPSQTLYPDGCGDENGDENENIERALEIRRKLTREIFKEAMRRGKFGITYYSNLADRLTDFFDYVMIEAASLKMMPEFSHTTFNSRVETIIVDSNVVPLIRWLKHNSVSYLQIAKLICASRGKLDSIRRIVEWLKSVRVKGEFLGSVLAKGGDNILERTNEELEEIVVYLDTQGVRSEWIGHVIGRCPRLLSCNFEEVEARVRFFLDMGMAAKDFGAMVFNFPKVLGHFTLEEMNEKVNFLQKFGLEAEEVSRLLASTPALMACSIEERWKPLLKYLYFYGITKDGMRRILTFKPMIFCFDLETTIVGKVNFFKDIGVREDAIGKILVKFPALLTYSLRKKIRPVVIFLLTKAGVSERDVGKVIAMAPELLGSSISQKLEVNVKYFLTLGIGVEQLGEMIADFPMLLRYNIDVLHPKYQYLRQTMIRPLQDAIKFPRFFSYSLQGRIIPRHKILVENRMNCQLRDMLATNDEEFKEMVEGILQKRREFESSVIADVFPGPSMQS